MALDPQSLANGEEQYEFSTCRVFRNAHHALLL